MPKHNPIRHDLTAVGIALALTIVEYWDDRNTWERITAVGRVVLGLAIAVTVAIALSGCKPTSETPAPVTGIDQGHVPFSPEQALVEHLQGANR